MAEKFFLRVIITLSLAVSMISFSNCMESEDQKDPVVSNETPISNQTVSSLSSQVDSSLLVNNSLPDNTGALNLSVSSFTGENVIEGNIVVQSVEVKPAEGQWVTISNYGSEGKTFHPVAGEVSSYFIDSYLLPVGVYKQVRLNINKADSKLLIQRDNGSQWIGFDGNDDHEGHKKGLKVHYDFTMENQYVIGMSLRVEVEGNSNHDGHGKNDHEKKSNHSDKSQKHDNSNYGHKGVKVELHVADVSMELYTSPVNGGSNSTTTTQPAQQPGTTTGTTTTNTTGNTTTNVYPTWIVQLSPTTSGLLAVTDTGSEKMSFGVLSAGVSSLDGINWNTEIFPDYRANINAIAGNNAGVYVVVGDSARVYGTSSKNGVRSWTAGNVGGATFPNVNFHGVAYGNAMFVIVGDKGLIYFSLDGITWKPASVRLTGNVMAVTFDGTKFIAAGTNGMVAYSTDGLTWTVAPAFSATSMFTAVSSNGTTAVFAGLNGEIWTTRDFVTFIPGQSAVTTNINGMNWNGSLFITAGDAGDISYSPDGLSWKAAAPTTTNNLRSVASALGADGLVHNTIVGDSGVILTSP